MGEMGLVGGLEVFLSQMSGEVLGTISCLLLRAGEGLLLLSRCRGTMGSEGHLTSHGIPRTLLLGVPVLFDTIHPQVCLLFIKADI